MSSEAVSWRPLLIDPAQDLEARVNSLTRALEFFDQAMAQPDEGTGTRRDAIEWLRSAAIETRDAYWAYRTSMEQDGKQTSPTSAGRRLPAAPQAHPSDVKKLREALRVALGESSSMTMPEVRELLK